MPLSILDVAQRGGMIPKYGRSNRCPFHQEQSKGAFVIYPDGHFYCYGCHAGGDAVTLYRMLFNVSAAEACTAVKGDNWRQQAKPPPKARRAANRPSDAEYAALCDDLHDVEEMMAEAETEDDLLDAVAMKARIVDALNNLECGGTVLYGRMEKIEQCASDTKAAD